MISFNEETGFKIVGKWQRVVEGAHAGFLRGGQGEPLVRVHREDAVKVDGIEGQTGIATEFERIGGGAAQVPTDEIQIMHIVQESLSNIRKHAKARHVRVVAKRESGRIKIDIEDDGVGFDPENCPNCLSDRHVGLKIMRERAHRIGGECRVASKPGAGSRVTLTLPRENKEAA